MKQRKIALAIALASTALGLAASPAAAAPSFVVQLSRDLAEVSHSDQRVDYTAVVRNTAHLAASPGDELFCDALPPRTEWSFASEFAFQWLANGESLGSANGAQTPAYTVQGADAGKAIQCRVVGSGTEASPASAAAATVTLPAVVVDPAPTPRPPGPGEALTDSNKLAAARPTLSGEEGDERTCQPPTNWVGATSYSYRWLRDGQPIAGANTSEYTPVEAEDKGTALQCEVTGHNVGGATAGISWTSAWSVVKTPNSNNDVPTVQTKYSSTGPMRLELELPGGEETFAYKVEGKDWACASQAAAGAAHARVSCTRSDVLEPERSYPPLVVKTSLGADAPDLAVARASLSGGGGAAAGAEDQFVFTAVRPFEITAFETKVLDQAGDDYVQAGGHPFSAGASFAFSKNRYLIDGGGTVKFHPVAHVRNVVTDTPPGFVGNVQALGEPCSSVQKVGELISTCPAGSVVGGIDVVAEGLETLNIPIYAVEPEFGTPAQFAFAIPATTPTIYTFAPRLRAEDNYAITLESTPAGQLPALISADVTLCGYGGKKGPVGFAGCKKPGEAEAYELPLITNPTRCGAPPPVTKLSVNTWEHPDQFASREFAAPEVEGCDLVEFEPKISIAPASHEADSPTGMDVELTMPTEGLEGKDEDGNPVPNPETEARSEANLKSATVTLPRGMAVNASAGHGLQACASDQIKLGTNDPISCPDGAKIGTVEIETPLLARKLSGDVYVAKQGDNPFGSLLAIYMVIESKRDGLLIKVAGRVDPDPDTGQLVVSFEENPEAPFSAVRLHFPQGPRSPLLNPPKCGTYPIESEFTPWNGGPAVSQGQSFEVDSGPNGAPCPSGALDPKMNAGVTDPIAGKTSPFVLRLHRVDGSDRFKSLTVHTPKGLAAYLKGIPYCPDSALAGISAAEGTGQAQIDHPSCPAASQVGSVEAGAGAGPDPFYVDTGRAYLAGPYKGAPLSLAVVVPAVAGPIDLGSVVVRNALRINPETAQVSVLSDPLPTILHGILLDVRDVRVKIDRPHFILNPTNCDAQSVGAEVGGEGGGQVTLSERFRVGECENLSFAPKFFVRLFGPTNRGGHPKLRTVLTAGAGEANIGRAAVTIPRSEFLDQAHIRTICTRVQFAAQACPKGSVYGYAKAFTPLLDYPVQGPVYLRSSVHKLPDLVVDLHGPAYQPIEAVVVGRIDSIKGQIRATIEGAPDVPVTKFILTQQGGHRGLLINSREICAHRYRATVRLTGQDGATHNFRPVVHNAKCASSSAR